MLHSAKTPFIARPAAPNSNGLFNSGLTLSGKSIIALMRANGQTIRGLSAHMGITIARVRHVREHGVQGMGYVWDWIEALQEAPHQ